MTTIKITQRLLVGIFALGFITLYQTHALSQENIFPRMIGKWRDLGSATTIIIEPDGRVYSTGGSIYGGVERTIEGGGNFAFENDKTRCAYDIAFLGPPLAGAASWKLRSAKVAGSCLESGTFVKLLPMNEANGKPTPDSLQYGDQSNKTQKDILEDDIKMAESTSDQLAYLGPSELKRMNIVYFERAADNDRIRTILQKNRIDYTTRESTQAIQSNVITCTPDVPLEAIKKLAEVLLDANIPIRSIEPSQYPDFPMRLTIESYIESIPNYPIIDRAKLEKITSCSYEPPNQSFGFSVKNVCTRAESIRVYVTYLNPSTNRLTVTDEKNIKYGERRIVTNPIGRPMFSNLKRFFVYAENETWLTPTLVWPNQADSRYRSNVYRTTDGRTRFWQKFESGSVQFDCP